MDHSAKYRQLGLNIAYYRSKNGLTQEELAEKLELSLSHIGKIETATGGKPSLEVIFSIADLLEIDVTKLFESR
jgi:transcriptional regulator with XRE-family HTH domain